MKICIYGASSNRLEPRYYEDARRFGTLLAEGGHSLIFGGGAGGLMGACAEGASGAEIIGVAPRFFDEPGILYPGCTRMIYTETMRERKAVDIMRRRMNGLKAEDAVETIIDEFTRLPTNEMVVDQILAKWK